ncbi:LysM peptidoglycan-binding domain-containing protein [Serinicoccus hydrothermalis]|nr:LysM peptidoglycan-binding domain-containing protein [Serinicoccus hydrothermalis]
MSTAIAHDILSPLPVTAPREVTRRHLRLVPTPTPGMPVARATPARALRLTRRGRLALTTTTSIVVALVAWSMLGLLGPADATSSVVVERGTTLSQIAAQELPDVPLSQAVTSIQRANSLSTTSVAAGQELVIPGR